MQPTDWLEKTIPLVLYITDKPLSKAYCNSSDSPHTSQTAIGFHSFQFGKEVKLV